MQTRQPVIPVPLPPIQGIKLSVLTSVIPTASASGVYNPFIPRPQVRIWHDSNPVLTTRKCINCNKQQEVENFETIGTTERSRRKCTICYSNKPDTAGKVQCAELLNEKIGELVIMLMS